MNCCPEISVIMSVYNCRPYIGEAIRSVLNQSYKDFEFIIIDDGSTDSSVDVINSFSDSRIKFIRNPARMGLAKNLNRAIDIARGRYIARMDADDVSLEPRFCKQIDYFKRHKDVGIVGSSILLDNTKNRLVHRYPAKPHQAKVQLLFGTCLAHPTVMLRKQILYDNNLRYSEEYIDIAQDFELWSRLAEYTNIANINECLLIYRCHDRQTSSVSRSTQLSSEQAVRLSLLKRMVRDLTPEEEKLFLLIKPGFGNIEAEKIDTLCRLFTKMLTCNSNKKMYNQHALAKRLGFELYKICRKNCRCNTKILRIFWRFLMKNTHMPSVHYHMARLIWCYFAG